MAMVQDSLSSRAHARRFAAELAKKFRRAGWVVQVGRREIDLRAALPPHRYAVEIKVASEARRDRILPLLSLAILHAQRAARRDPDSAQPLAVVAALHVPEGLLPVIREFASAYAPDIAVGIFDLDGLFFFLGPGLEFLNAPHARISQRGMVPPPARGSQLFSDLNQWMLKVLLAPRISESWLSAPRREYQNASQLAEASNVSVMSAFRFVRQLRQEHFLDEDAPQLRLVRVDALMRLWQAANLRVANELPMRWILRRDPEQQLHEAVRAYRESVAARSKRRLLSPLPRICLGLFAAANLLGAGFVHGPRPHIYLERSDPEALELLGLAHADAAHIDVYLRFPGARSAVFRAAVIRDGMPVSDILQVWLDVSAHSSRGEEQAEEIRRRFLSSLFNLKS